MKKRSNEKRITRASIILRHMRLSRNYSLNKAGKLLKISGSAIAHMEQGRMDLSRCRIESMIEAYGYSISDYLEYFDGKEVPLNLRDECLKALKMCREDQLKILFPLISGMTK